MSGWSPVIESNDTVTTPEGVGKVRRVAGNGTVQVDVDGQLFEFPSDQVIKEEGVEPIPEIPDFDGEPEGGDIVKDVLGVEPTPSDEFNVGDTVKNKDGHKAKVTDITQRSVKVKYEGAKHERAYPKKTAGEHLTKVDEPNKPQEPNKPDAPAPKQVQDAGDTIFQLMQLKEHLQKKIDDSVDAELKDIKDLAKKHQKLEVIVGDKAHIIDGLKHKQLEQLITYAMLRLSPLLVGMAGTGKTHAGEQTSKALGLPFYAMSVGAQTSKSDIIGYMDASGRYVKTHFRDAYEKGGVFLMDEIDAGNANVLIQINAALSNDLCSFPDAMVKRHPDFVFIASANTFGNGANRQYVGRNQLDAATLDRFAVIEWLIDDELESNLTTGLNGKAWYMAVRAARDYVAEKNIRALISPRATQKGSRLLDVGQPVEEVIHATMLGSVPEDKKQDVQRVATSIFNKFASDVPSKIDKKINPEVNDLIQF